MKTCRRCGVEKSDAKFAKGSKQCRVCCTEKYREKRKEYREANKERLNEKNRAYYEANKEQRRAKGKAYYETIKEQRKAEYAANKEKFAAKNKAYYEANREKLAEQSKVYYEANREKLAKQSKVYNAANREKRAQSMAAYVANNKEKLAAYREANKVRIAATRKAYNAKNKEKQKAYDEANKAHSKRRASRRKYGVSHEDYPYTKCPIIRHLPATCIDHAGGCSTNTYTRGKVSWHANLLMGLLNDDAQLLRRAAAYIQGEVILASHIADVTPLSKTMESSLKSKYNLTAKQQWGMLCQQGWGCGICQCRLARTRKSAKVLGGSYPATDHCHRTGEVRGMLCANCNAALGHAEKPVDYDLVDTIWILERAAQYLETYNLAPQESYKSAYFHEDDFWKCVLM